MRVHLYTHRLADDQMVQLQRAVTAFHGAQDALALVMAGERELPRSYAFVDFDRDIAPLAREATGLEITATGFPLADNWFTHTKAGSAVMTVADWQVAFLQQIENMDGAAGQALPFPTAAPDAYLLQSLTLITFLLIARATDRDYMHMATTGCIADLCADKRTRAIKMRAGYICTRCREKASAAGVSPIALDAIHALAECVRALAMGREPQPRTVGQERAEDDKWIDQLRAPDLPPALIAAAQDRRMSVVVGSGLSVQSDVEVSFPARSEWTRLPSWPEVPFRLSSALKRYRARDVKPRATADVEEFLADMDFFRQALGVESYYPRAIFDAFAPAVRSPGRANRLVFRLPVGCVITTNYDLVLNHAAPSGTATFTWKEARQAREYLARAEGALAPLVKIHGCASRPDTVVLTQSEYNVLQADKAYGSMMRSVFESMAVLFLGFGLNDPLDLDIALDAANHAGAAQGDKFALLPKAQAGAVRQRFPAINVIEFDEPAEVPAAIGALIRATQ